MLYRGWFGVRVWGLRAQALGFRFRVPSMIGSLYDNPCYSCPKKWFIHSWKSRVFFEGFNFSPGSCSLHNPRNPLGVRNLYSFSLGSIPAHSPKPRMPTTQSVVVRTRELLSHDFEKSRRQICQVVSLHGRRK